MRLSECQPLPGVGSNSARIWAFCHQACNRAAPTAASGFLGAGSTGAFPANGNGPRASLNTESASGVTGVTCS